MSALPLKLTISALVLATLSTSALAQTASPAGQTPIPLSARPALNLSDNRVSVGTDGALINRTSVEHAFGPSQMVGSVGYLCGLEPKASDNSGAGSTFGPVGTFLGAKLTMAFK